MRIVGIVSELHHAPGIYGCRDPLSTAEVRKLWQSFATQSKRAIPSETDEASGALVILSVVALAGIVLNATSIARYDSLWSRAVSSAWNLLWPTGLKRIGDLPNSELRASAARELPPQDCIVIPASFVRQGLWRHKDPMLYSLFRKRRQLSTLLKAEGGNVDIWIVDAKSAQRHFQHYGGESGRFAVGLHLPHPKAHNVLLPAQLYSELLRDEVLQDWVRAFEALGAKKCVICDTTSAQFNASVVAPEGGVTAELKAQYGKDVLRESDYDPGTFDPHRALDDKKWIADFRSIWSIVEGRLHGKQRAYRETVTVNTAFGLNTSVLKTWGVNVQGSFERKFQVAVDFYPKIAGS